MSHYNIDLDVTAASCDLGSVHWREAVADRKGVHPDLIEVLPEYSTEPYVWDAYYGTYMVNDLAWRYVS